MQQSDTHVKPVQWQGDYLLLLDQRKLPNKEVYLKLDQASAVATAIRDMVVRGAPAIGITAAYGAALAARSRWQTDPAQWKLGFGSDLKMLMESRPTAVNLYWALARMQAASEVLDSEPFQPLLQEAQAIHREDFDANLKMATLGSTLIEPGSRVLTHCNTGSLATGGYGTALGVIRNAYAAGKLEKIYAGETRPWLQGSRLTAWELQRDNIPVTLLCEGAAASLFKTQRIDWVIVGADRIAANGDVINKIGTYSLAVLARHHGARFMVVAPISSIDSGIAQGAAVKIEYRSADEILNVQGLAVGTRNTEVWNPVFDLTPVEWVDAIVTEAGVVQQPNHDKVADLLMAATSHLRTG